MVRGDSWVGQFCDELAAKPRAAIGEEEAVVRGVRGGGGGGASSEAEGAPRQAATGHGGCDGKRRSETRRTQGSSAGDFGRTAVCFVRYILN
jgi:hypothetical protein